MNQLPKSSTKSPSQEDSVAIYGVDIKLFKKFNNQVLINKCETFLKKIMRLKPHKFDFIMFLIIAMSYVIVIFVTIKDVMDERERNLQNSQS